MGKIPHVQRASVGLVGWKLNLQIIQKKGIYSGKYPKIKMQKKIAKDIIKDIFQKHNYFLCFILLKLLTRLG
jgi:hypothetical protein